MAPLLKPHPAAHCFVGGPATGKSTALARRACTLASSGKESVLVVCAAPRSLEKMKELVGNGRNGGNVQVVTARELALEAMSDPAAHRRFGRGTRVLNAAEERIFFEDMRPCGLRQRRLHELLAFLCRGWSDLSDEDSDWIQTAEEVTCGTLVHANLTFTGGMLEHELANMAAKTLRDDQAARVRHVRDHVLVDDYGLIGRASQILTTLIARRSMSIATDDTAPMRVYEAYPHAQGLDEFLEANPHATVHRLTRSHRPVDIVKMLNSLRADEAIGGSSLEAAGTDEGRATVTVRMEPDLAEECQAIVETVQKAHAEGVNADDILVVGTSAAWRANVAQALKSCGIPARCMGKSCHVRGKNAGQASASRMRVIECLVRHPDDSVAWRTWCGFGDPLARSAAIARLRQAAEPRGIKLAEALRLLATDGLEGAKADDPLLAGLVEAYREGMATMQTAADHGGPDGGPGGGGGRGREGGGFWEAGAVGSPPGTSGTFDSSGTFGAFDPSDAFATRYRADDVSEDTAPHVFSVGRQAGCSREAVTVCPPSDAFGPSVSLVIFGGFVNGLIPSRDYCDPGRMVGDARRRAHQADLQAIHLCASRARERLVFTGFTSCGLETGERLGLHIDRIRLRDGARVCTIEPSDLLEFVTRETEGSSR